MEQPEAGTRVPHRRKQLHRNVDQPESERPFPDGSCHDRVSADREGYSVFPGAMVSLSTTSLTPSVAFTIAMARSRPASEATVPVSVTTLSVVLTLMSERAGDRRLGQPHQGGAVHHSRDDPKTHRADLKRPWELVSRRAGLDNVRIHDLRHTHASVGAGSGIGLQLVGKLLGHSSPQVTARYAHVADNPLRRASNRIGARIAAAMGETGKPAASVTKLRRRK